MTRVVIDTDVVSFLFKKDTRAVLYRPHLLGTMPHLSFMTLAELDHWAVSRRWGKIRRERLALYLLPFTVVYADRDLCLRWAEATGEAESRGRPIPATDAWNAAVALALDCPLVTHNPADYAGLSTLTVLSAAP